MMRFILILVLAIGLPLGLFAEENYRVDPMENEGPNLDLLKPISEYLSGRAWLISQPAMIPPHQ